MFRIAGVTCKIQNPRTHVQSSSQTLAPELLEELEQVFDRMT